MSSYCLKCRKKTKNINPRVFKIKNNKALIISKYINSGIDFYNK